MFLAQGHNAVLPERLGPATPQSRVKHSTTALPGLTSDFYLSCLLITFANSLEPDQAQHIRSGRIWFQTVRHSGGIPVRIFLESFGKSADTWADPESFVRGGPTLTFLFVCFLV